MVWPSGSLCSNNGTEEEVVGAKGHRFAPFCAPVAGCQHFPPLRIREFEAVTDVTLEGQSLVSLPSASTSGSSPWFRKEAFLATCRARGTDTYLDDFGVYQALAE
jgi:hypothetical protein